MGSGASVPVSRGVSVPVGGCDDGGGAGGAFTPIDALAWNSPSYSPDLDPDGLFNGATYDPETSQISISIDKGIQAFPRSAVYWFLNNLAAWASSRQILEVTIQIGSAPSSRTTRPCLLILVNDGEPVDGIPAIWGGVAFNADGTTCSIARSRISTGMTIDATTVSAAHVAAVRLYCGPSASGDVWCPTQIQLLDASGTVLDQAQQDDGAGVGTPGRLAFCFYQPAGTTDATPILTTIGIFYRLLGDGTLP